MNIFLVVFPAPHKDAHGDRVERVSEFGSMCRFFLIVGYFSQISTLADVPENVMRYLHVMSRPKVIDHEHDTVWTEAYVDSAVSVLPHSECMHAHS